MIHLEWLKATLINIYAFLSITPFIPFLGAWFISYFVWKDKKKAIGLAMDITTFFLVGSVSVMLNEVFNITYGFWLILLFLLMGGGLIGNVQNKKYESVDFKRLIKVIWRIAFLLLTVMYILLLISGIIKHIVS